MATTFKVLVDWDRNNAYDEAINDITSYVLGATWQLGMVTPYQETANNPILELTLHNADGIFSPENVNSPLYGKVNPQAPVKIVAETNPGVWGQAVWGQSTYGPGQGERVMWTGWLSEIKPIPGRNGSQHMVMIAKGAVQFYRATETKLGLQKERRTDEIISDLVGEVVYPPATAGVMILNQTNLGSGTLAGESLPGTDLDTGTYTVGYAGDNWVRQGGYSNVPQTSFDVYRAIGDITAAERGKFYFDREGQAVFWNRSRVYQPSVTVSATFDDTMQDMAYAYAGVDHLKNEVIVIAHPRSVSAGDQELLWELDGGLISVPANGNREVYVKYDGEDTVRVGAEEVTYTDLTFDTTTSNGTASLSIEEAANGANLVFTNTTNEIAYVKTLKLRGRKLVDRGRLEARAVDNGSVGLYGRRTLRLNLSSVDSLDDAQAIADLELARRKDPRGMVTFMTLRSNSSGEGTHHLQQLVRAIGDRITITETQTGHSDDYIIIGESHALDARQFNTQRFLEPVYNIDV